MGRADPRSKPTIAELRLGADPAAWERIGFEITAGHLTLGGTRISFVAPANGTGLIDWRLRGIESTDLDGLATTLDESPGAEPGASPALSHPNSALAIDHVVVFTADLERTISGFEVAGVECRRVREVGPPEQQLRQAFFRFGEVIVEAVEVPADQAGPAGAARFWGLTVAVADLDGLVAELGPAVSGIRDAVQPGRRIATMRRQAGLGIPVALISPEGRD